ncbi:unnamed protein product, partial [Candidula unifasciata]
TLGSCLDESHCYTLEVSFFSYQTNTTGQSMPYTEEAYMKLGRNLARTFLDYYKLTGFITARPMPGIQLKQAGPLPRHRDKSWEKPSLDPFTIAQGDTLYSNKLEIRDDCPTRKASDLNMMSPKSYCNSPPIIMQHEGHRT